MKLDVAIEGQENAGFIRDVAIEGRSQKPAIDEHIKVSAFNQALSTLLEQRQLKFKWPGGVEVGDLVLWKDKLQKVVATGYEQGSGPRPSRCSLAFMNNESIVEIDNVQEKLLVISPNK